MPFSPSDSEIFAPLFADDALSGIFTDHAYIGYLVRVEAALARVQGELGVIPPDAAERISQSCQQLTIAPHVLAEGVRQDGFPIIALVKQIQTHAGEQAADYVHFGATTQDIMDTALVLQIRDALALLEDRLVHTIRALAALADKHRSTLMAGRTHSQHALPIPFGLQVATWLAPLLEHHARLAEIKPRLLVLQFGGAVGTLAALGDNGIAVQQALAHELMLGVPLVPWHTQRATFAEFTNWLSLVTGSLGKMAQDILLLAQTEIHEVRESADLLRGGSSTMPQKRNPVRSEIILALARANASLVSNMQHALVQEHQRGTYGWQLEWLTLPQMIANTGAALNHALDLADHLVVDKDRMLHNVRASNGLMLAEAITFALAEHMPRSKAKKLVELAAERVVAEQRHLVDLVREQTNAPVNWEILRAEENYLGAAQLFIQRVIDVSIAVPAKRPNVVT